MTKYQSKSLAALRELNIKGAHAFWELKDGTAQSIWGLKALSKCTIWDLQAENAGGFWRLEVDAYWGLMAESAHAGCTVLPRGPGRAPAAVLGQCQGPAGAAPL